MKMAKVVDADYHTAEDNINTNNSEEARSGQDEGELKVKIICLGDSAVGKSKLMERFLIDGYKPHQSSTYALTLYQYDTEVDGQKVAVAANSCQSPPAVPRNVALAIAPITHDPTTGAGPLRRSLITRCGLCSGDYCEHQPICIRPSSPLANPHSYEIAFPIRPTYRNGGVSSFGSITALHARHKRTLLCRELRLVSLSCPHVYYIKY
ncbi:RABL2 [Acanthosepion pharaonis]|uniref:RABL2 n=1 Tax=Acanthosepion pharaonis TaxID=158019 RepID=A0A812EEJ4_ACAPH|nr:RABL2 [Sepia pharaonis]